MVIKATRWILLGFTAAALLPATCFGQADRTPAQPANDSALPPGLSFSVASVRPSDPGTRIWRLQFGPASFDATGVTVHDLISEAYGLFEQGRILGEPSWATSRMFDIKAVIDPADVPGFEHLELGERRDMIKRLLADRFQLKVHQDQKLRPVYLLEIAAGGSRLQVADPSQAADTGIKGLVTLISKNNPGVLEGRSLTTAFLAQDLESSLGRIVLDRTHLAGHYDLALHWTPDPGPVGSPDPAHPPSDFASNGPPLEVALREQLGLRVVPSRELVDVLVVESVQPPSEN